jgi:hypothetical protein
MAQTLWGKTKTRRRRKRSIRQQKATAPYAITDGNDCEILGHTLNHFDLAGTTTCITCHVNLFCPQCIENHSRDPQAVPVLCPLHEQRQVN